jgi:hypothetical protein
MRLNLKRASVIRYNWFDVYIVHTLLSACGKLGTIAMIGFAFGDLCILKTHTVLCNVV